MYSCDQELTKLPSWFRVLERMNKQYSCYANILASSQSAHKCIKKIPSQLMQIFATTSNDIKILKKGCTLLIVLIKLKTTIKHNLRLIIHKFQSHWNKNAINLQVQLSVSTDKNLI